MNKKIAIIGAGPAGLSAALWLKNLGFTPIVIERESVTGGMQNFNFLNNDWVLGQAHSTGLDVAKSFYQHVQQENICIYLNTSLVRITKSTIKKSYKEFCLSLSQADEIIVGAVILANGTRYVSKKILAEIAGVEHVNPNTIIEGPYTFLGIDTLEPQHVAILGAGDNAFENALMLLKHGHKVSIISRSVPKAQKKFIDAISAYGTATVFEKSDIVEFLLDGKLLHLQLSGSQSLHVDRLHVLAGYQSNSDSVLDLFKSGLGQALHCDSAGFLRADAVGRTSIDGIYAAGDICNTAFPCVVSAVAAGALAAKTISCDLS